MNELNSKEHPLSWVRMFQRKLYCAAKSSKNRRFGVLYDKVCSEKVLEEAWKRVSRKNGCCGVDKCTIDTVKREYGVSEFLLEIQNDLKSENYKPNLIQRVYIPKANGKDRPLGIPTVKDRVVQMAVKLIIEPLFEPDFLNCSYGFRPKRSNSQAVAEAHRQINTRKWVVDLDLKGYFDNIPHEELMRHVSRRVGDPRILGLIRQWLTAGIMEEGKIRNVLSGTPQGGVLSPLLSNIYLHEFDRKWDWRDGVLIRFADDMVILCGSEERSMRAMEIARELLDGLKLKLNEEKTHSCHIKDGFDFLGFTFREAYSQRRKKLVRIKYPKQSNKKAVCAKIKDAVKSMLTGAPISEIIAKVNRKLRGWANYFKIGNSYETALSISNFACEQLRIFWRRRKQCKNIRGTNTWMNSYFYGKGLYYVPHLL